MTSEVSPAPREMYGAALWRSLWSSGRQLLFPREFRISALPRIVPGVSLPGATESAGGDHTACARRAHADGGELEKLLRSMTVVVTALWRAQSKLAATDDRNPTPAMRLIARHLDTAWDGLEQCGIRIQDHTDARYLSGMAVNPISFQPTLGIKHEVIKETLKPAIHYGGRLIQRADVIVAQPVEEAGPAKLEE